MTPSAVPPWRAQRRALERALDALEADPASCAYDARTVQSVAAATEGGSPVDHPSRRQAPSLDQQGQGGADPRARPTAQEYAADLARETDRSLARDPERWTRRQTNEIPKDRSVEREGPP